MPIVSIKGIRLSGQFSWEANIEESSSNELNLNISFIGRLGKKGAFTKLERVINEGQINWIKKDGKRWLINLDILKQSFTQLTYTKFIKGFVVAEAEYEMDASSKVMILTHVYFSITEAEIRMSQSRKIFLSHKSKDKKLVRRFQRALEATGHDVWIDEKNLKAGDHLERSILKGFKESCAAVFFITENFKDEKYLEREINYAITQKTEKGDFFSIITLELSPPKTKIEIPDLLREYVWKCPASELDALTEIIKALPIEPKQFDFKS